MVLKFPPRKPYDPGVRVGWPAITVARPPMRAPPKLAMFQAGLDRIDHEARRERLWIVLEAVAEGAAIGLFLFAILVGMAIFSGALT
jgi:hypothetical protein